MTTKRITLMLGGFLVLGGVRDADADPLHRRLEMSIEAIVNPVEGSPGPRCATASSEMEPLRKMEWWVAFGEAAPKSGAWQATGSSVQCGAGSLEQARSDLERLTGRPYLLVGISTLARPVPEALVLVEVSLSVRKLTGFDKERMPVYEAVSDKRSFFFSKVGETFVPLLVSNSTEKDSFGLQELLLRVEARQLKEQDVYGVISVSSGMNGAKVLLDGGVVGSISPGKDTVLRNVRAGEHEVAVRDSTGRRIRRLIRVEADRMFLVALNLPGQGDMASRPLAPLGKNSQGHDEYRRGSDGALVVKIPAGEFLMGNKETERNPLEHRVYVSSFLIDKTAVTWSQYKGFAEATGTPLPPDEPWWGVHDDHPAVFVTWEEGKAYCEWVGGRLPTEAEREKGCRGTDERMYAWGNEEPDTERAVFRRAWGFAATDPVGAHPSGANPYGLLDMSGNVWEWCADWYDDKYYEVSPARDPQGPASGQSRVVRGGSWDSRPSVLSCSCRNWGNRGYREGDFGFRCAMDAPE
jgi:formylglycine-generating enzyme required for sulfatase activity